MPPIDWNIVKYLNPDKRVMDKMDEQSLLSDKRAASALAQAYQQLQNQKMQQDITDEQSLQAELANIPKTGDEFKDLQSLATAYARKKMQLGQPSDYNQLLQSLDPLNKKLREAEIYNKRSLADERGREKPDRVRVFLLNPETGEQRYVPRDQVDDLLEQGWEKLGSEEDPIQARINAAFRGRGAPTSQTSTTTSRLPTSKSPPPGLSFEEFKAWKRSNQ